MDDRGPIVDVMKRMPLGRDFRPMFGEEFADHEGPFGQGLMVWKDGVCYAVRGDKLVPLVAIRAYDGIIPFPAPDPPATKSADDQASPQTPTMPMPARES